ncbi:MAG TPA: type II toxin-antitoxin system RelE/ParE family toxin [Verrucomicrobiales bacterium]|jgi:plasmid stabilization system protein ParE|nr:type II toxin-antitoxin system RelE/ParE family toxin [Verrucomicrobiales bacterium]
MTHGFEREALEEYKEAAAWYESQRQGLGGEFVSAVEAAIQDVTMDPGRFQPVGDNLRILRMKRFPYYLIFRWLEDRQHITIFVVMHRRRRPGYWRHRLAGEG